MADAVHNQLQRSSWHVVRWDARSGQRLGPPRQIDGTAEAALVGFTGHGAQVVASIGAQRATAILDAATLRLVRRLRGGSARAALSLNGRLVAFGAADGTVRILDLHTGALRTAADRHDGMVTDLRFTPDARRLLTSGADGRLIEWNVADGQRIETFTGHAGSVSRIAIAPDGRSAYAGGEDGTVIAWDLAGDRRLDRPFTAPARSATVFPGKAGGNGPTNSDPTGASVPVAGFAVASTPNGRGFAVPDDAGYVDVLESRTLKRTGRIPVSPGTQVAAVALSPDGRTVAATTQDGHLRFGDLRNPQRLGPSHAVTDWPVWSLAFSGDGRWLATAGDITSSAPPLELWDVRRRRLAYTALLSPMTSYATDVAFSPAASGSTTPTRGRGAAIRLSITPAPWSPSASARTDARWPRRPTTVTGADAMIACFDAKYHYWFWRPYQAIPRAGMDGNPNTTADLTWQPLATTSNFPEYPSAHACHSTAVVTALAAFFGTDKLPMTLDSRVTGTTRRYDRLHDIVKDVDWARVLVGFHFRNSDLEGSALGRNVGRYVARHDFQPIG